MAIEGLYARGLGTDQTDGLFARGLFLDSESGGGGGITDIDSSFSYPVGVTLWWLLFHLVQGIGV